MSKKLILLIEDNKKVQKYNSLLLRENGFEAAIALTIADARAFMERRTPDAIVLDRGMPDGSGLDFLKELRRTSMIPVLMLTGYREEFDEIQGFDTGCDDYIKKPYTFDVLLRRLNRLLKTSQQVPETITRGGLTLKPASSEAFVNGANIGLTPKEYDLLQYFVQNEGRIMTPEQVYEAVWGQPMTGDANAVKNAVVRLRKKLTGCGYTISNNYGSGYQFEHGEP